MLSAVQSEYPAGLVATVASGDSVRFSSFMMALGALKVPQGSAYNMIGSAYVHKNRNGAVEKLLAHDKWQWLLFVDDDNPPMPDMLLKLLAHNVDVVGGLYLHRAWPFYPHVYRRSVIDPNKPYENLPHTDIKADTLMAVDAVATGGMLIRRPVLEKLGPQCFNYMQVPNGSWMGEDLSFCMRAQDAGFGIFVDTAVALPHLRSFALTPAFPNGECTPAIILDNGLAVLIGSE